MYHWIVGVCLVVVCQVDMARCGRSSAQDETSEQDKNQIATAAKFLKILEKNPRQGTALDRVYSHAVEFGTLGALVQDYQTRVLNSPGDGDAWMLLGLLQMQRGEDADAAQAFQKATELRSQDPMAAFYLGQALLRLGQADAAVPMFEEAITRQPARVDFLEIYQQLGRLYQRTQQTQKALEVWQRLESVFPNDARVQEQIAVSLFEEGDYASALPRYEKMARDVKDDYRRVQYQMQVADIKFKLNRKSDGIADLEGTLSSLNPESWLYRDVRKRIEDSFLNSSDQDGLVQYYQKWLETHANDVDGMVRLARILRASARITESMPWLEKAIALAPSRSDLRKALIDQYLEESKFAEANSEFEKLVKIDPSNTDYLRDWGKTILKDRSRDAQTARSEATAIWNRMIQLRPNDAATYVQVADLNRLARFDEDALSLYRKAIELAPNDPQYREYLGEYLHGMQRGEEALAVWRQMAEGTRRTAENVFRLAQILKRFGMQSEAADHMVDACLLEPKDLMLHLDTADYLAKVDRTDEALTFIAKARSLAETEEDHESVLKQNIEVLQAAKLLASRITALSKELAENPMPSSVAWYELARYAQSERLWIVAADAIRKSLELDNQSVRALTAAASIAESSGDLKKAIEWSRQLTKVDRRYLAEHLMTIAKCEAQLDHSEAALEAAREIIVSAPGNTEHYEFFAQLCFRLKKVDQGLDALRKALRIQPKDPHLTLALGTALMDHAKPDEALDLFWRAFDSSSQLDDQTSLITKMVPIYVGKNQTNGLIDRLQKLRTKAEDKRALTICLSQVHATLKEFAAARKELESLLDQDTKDTNLLQQLAKVCLDANDVVGAIQYQRRLVSIAPGSETEMPLANMLLSSGKAEEAGEIMIALARRENDLAQLLKSLDSLILTNTQAVLKIVPPMSDQWELLYREGMAHALLNQSGKAKACFARLLALPLPHETLGINSSAKLKTSQAKAKSENLKGNNVAVPTSRSAVDFWVNAGQINIAIQQSKSAQSASVASQRTTLRWMPDAFGLARMASYAWLMKLDTFDANLQQLRLHLANVNDTSVSIDRETLLDMMYLSALENRRDALVAIARRVAKDGPAEHEFYLNCVSRRFSVVADPNVTAANLPGADHLNEGDLDLLLYCFERIPRDKQVQAGVRQTFVSSSNQATMQQAAAQARLLQQIQILQNQTQTTPPPGQSNASQLALQQLQMQQLQIQMQQMKILEQSAAFQSASSRGASSRSAAPSSILEMVHRELLLAGKTERANTLIRDFIASASNLDQLDLAMIVCLQTDHAALVKEYFPKWCEFAKRAARQSGSLTLSTASASSLPTGMATASSTFFPATGVQPSMMMSSSALSRIGGLMGTTAGNANSAGAWIPRWMGERAELDTMDQVFEVLDSVLEIASVKSPSATLISAASTGNRAIAFRPVTTMKTQFLIHYGNEALYQVCDTLPENAYVDNVVLHVLRQSYEIATRNRLALAEHLRDQAEKTGETLRIVNLLCSAAICNWSNEPEDGLRLLNSAAELAKNDHALRLAVASMLEQRDNVDRAMELVDTTSPIELTLQQRKDWLLVHLAWRVGDLKRSEAAAKRLLAFPLDNASLSGLAILLNRQGLNSLAQAANDKLRKGLTSRPRTTRTTPTPSPAMSSANSKAAAEAAKQRLLQTSQQPIMLQAINGVTTVRTTDPTRRSAIALLKSYGQLESWLGDLEQQMDLEKSNFLHYGLMVDIYRSLGDTKSADAVFQKGIIHLSDPSPLYIQNAIESVSKKDYQVACDMYLKAWATNKFSLNTQLPMIVDAFQNANRIDELEKSLKDFEFSEASMQANGPSTPLELFRVPELKDVLVRQIELAFHRNAQRNLQMQLRMLKELSDRRLSDVISKIMPSVASMLIPEKWSTESSPWFGLDDSASIILDGKASGVFGFVMMHTTPKEASDFADLLAAKASEFPSWKAGPVMLALLRCKSDPASTEKNVKAIRESLLPEIASLALVPTWNIARECDQIADLKPFALQLYERCLEFTIVDVPTAGIAPLQRCVELGDEIAKVEQVAELLKNHYRRIYRLLGQSTEPDALKVNAMLWIAARLVEWGYAMDAIAIYEQVRESPVANNVAQIAASISSRAVLGSERNGVIKVKERCDSGIQAAVAKLSVADAIKSIEALLDDRRVDNGTNTIIPFRIEVTHETEFSSYRIRSRWLDRLQSLMDAHAGNEAHELARKWDQAIADLRSKHPTDLSLAIVSAWNRVKYFDEDASPQLEELVQMAGTGSDIVDLFSVEGYRKAMERVPLFFVAQASLKQKRYAAFRDKLADLALDAAKQLPHFDQGLAIASQLHHDLKSIGDSDAQARLRDRMLSDLVSRRPRRKNDAGQQLIAPLDVETYNQVLTLAIYANSHKLHDLEYRAIREALIGGPPVIPVNQTLLNQIMSSGQINIQSTTPGTTVVFGAPTATVARNGQDSYSKAINNTLGAWSLVRKWREASRPADAAYETLLEIVLPAHRPEDLLSYHVPQARNEGEYPSLASELVYWAQQAGKLDELEKRAANRVEFDPMPTAYSNVPSMSEMIRTARAQQ
jgi:tetratricopeptide (TPR) repeat protein